MACIFHPDRPEATSCARCRRLVCSECVSLVDDRALCTICRKREESPPFPSLLGPQVSGALRTGTTPAVPPGSAPEITGFLEKLQALIVRPADFFAGLREQGAGDWSFFLRVAWPSAVLTTAFRVLLAAHSGRLSAGGMLLVGGIVALLAPLILALTVAVETTLAHLTLLALGGHRAGFAGSMRVVLYALSIYYLVGWIPLCGAFVGLPWSITLLIIGLHDMHRTTYPKAVAAGLMPILLCCCALLALFAMLYLPAL